MSYQLKRINPFWHTHPMVATMVAVGALCGLIGFQTQMPPVAVIGAAIAGLSILFATRPLVSAVLATLGLFGGLVTFVLVPNVQSAGMSLAMRLVSTVLFALFYMVLMDALVLVVAVLYNLFSGVFGLGGIQLEMESEAPAEDEV